MMNIQWYPGHMTKSIRIMRESISLVDVVIELLDSRVPYSSRNPDIDDLAKNKKRIIILNKSDLADNNFNTEWENYFKDKGFEVIVTDSSKGKGLGEIYTTAQKLMKEKIESQKQRGRIFVPIRVMIVGIPNVGKSTLINKIIGKKITQTGDRPGVTRSKQWVKIRKDFELLDTPGILWPKFENQEVGVNLAITGAIKDDILDTYTLSTKLCEKLLVMNPACLEERYKIKIEEGDDSHMIIAKIGESRGFKLKGNTVDVDKTAIILLDEFRGGKLGKISLERPSDYDSE